MDKLIILFLVILKFLLAVQIVICYQRLASVTGYQPTPYNIPQS